MAWLKFNEIKKSEKEIKQEVYKQLEIIKRHYRMPELAALDPDDEETFDKYANIYLNTLIAADSSAIAEEPIEFPEDSDTQNALDILRRIGGADELLQNYKHTLLIDDLNYAIAVLESIMPPEEQIALGLNPDPALSPQGLTWISDDRSWGITKDEYGNVNLVTGIKDCQFTDKLLEFLETQPEAVSSTTRKALGITENLDVFSIFQSKQIPEDVDIEIDLSTVEWNDEKIEKAVDVILAFLCYRSSLLEECEVSRLATTIPDQEALREFQEEITNDPYYGLIKELTEIVVSNIETDHHFYKDISKVVGDNLFIDQLHCLQTPLSLSEFKGLSNFDYDKLAAWYEDNTGKVIEKGAIDTLRYKFLKQPADVIAANIKRNLIDIFSNTLHTALKTAKNYIRVSKNLAQVKTLLYSSYSDNTLVLCQGKSNLRPTVKKPCQNKVDFKRPKFDFIVYLLTELVYHSFSPFDLRLLLFLFIFPFELQYNILINFLRRWKILDYKPFDWVPYVPILASLFPPVLQKKFESLSNLIRVEPKWPMSTAPGAVWWLKTNFCNWGGQRRKAEVTVWGEKIEVPCSIAPEDIKKMQQRGDERFPKLVAQAYGVGIDNFQKIVGGWTWVTEYEWKWTTCWWGFIPYPCRKKVAKKVKKYVAGDTNTVKQVLKEAIEIWNQNAFVNINDKCKYLKNKPKNYVSDPESMKKLIRDGEL